MQTSGRQRTAFARTCSALAVPGWSLVRDPSRRPGRVAAGLVLVAAGSGAPLALAAELLVGRRSWVALTIDRGFLARTAVVVGLALLSRLAAVADVVSRDWRSVSPVRTAGSTGRFDRWSLPLAVAVCVPLGIGLVQVVDARDDLRPVFTPVATDGPLFDNDVVTVVPSVVPTSTADVQGTTVVPDGPAPNPALDGDVRPRPIRPDSGVDPVAVADVRAVLLLGGDAGPDRGGLRTDTMMLFLIDVASGRAGLVSVPRDMKGMLFPPGTELAARYPYGWDDLANAVYPKVSADEELRAAYAVDGVRPGVVALAQALGYSLDVTIDDYVLVDMQGFLELIDAVGGVTINVRKEIPMPGNVPGAPTQYPDTIGPGVIHMDGTTALGYVRSRYADSDFQRTRRQRELLAALATQIDLTRVVSSFPGVAEALGGTLRTSLTPDELADILAVIGGETAIVESMGLVPPLIDIEAPDFQRMAEIVGEVRLALATGVPSGF
ncbi:MAG: LCP family protein [Ilumatobacteraceae bacterium]